ncbi:MAG: cysteine--tRNA ligase [Candidatus Omnitrophica bacterium]|nr:cysteine--tRNA ligase [Candidatus Omnitrophota bacterium]
MTITIHNSLTRKKEALVPVENQTIRMYTCGVTVYDLSHIGHARSLCVFDMIRRYLKYRGFDVKFVRNITDVDDKIINRARETNKTSTQVAEENIKAYYEDLKRLGVDAADHEPKATDQENIDEMLKFISGLIEKGFAYDVDGDVYFSVRQFKDYGKLSGQSIEKMQEAVRIGKDAKKKDPLDFVLWKKSKEGDPFWESPWGKGRPGWHIECSCMSLKHLNCQTLDIHAGGQDLVFPHHENEIAQAEAFTGTPFAKYWIHHGLLTINSQKMAKSSGNFITIKDAVDKYGANTLKMFFLSSHYSSNIDFNEEKIEESRKSVERLTILLQKLSREELICDKKQVDEVKAFQQKFEESMDDDFNTPKALAVIYELINWTNKSIESDGQDKALVLHDAKVLLEKILHVFSLRFDLEQNEDIGQDIQDLLAERKQARADKSFKRSDEIRDELKEKGILVEDSKDGQTWRRA